VFEQLLLGILPIVLLARLVPEEIHLSLNIDFPAARKIFPAQHVERKKWLGIICRARQILPGWVGKKLHFA